MSAARSRSLLEDARSLFDPPYHTTDRTYYGTIHGEHSIGRPG